MLDRGKFFARVRDTVFEGRLTEQTVLGLTSILDEWDARMRTADLRWLAYKLATVRRECGPNMLPVREGFGKSDAQSRAYVARQGYKYAKPDPATGEVYYGRGLVQLTWADNYKRAALILGVDFYNDPDLALEPRHAASIMFLGMTEGWFAGDRKGRHSLTRYFSATVDDPIGARRIINGQDHAAEIAGYHRKFLAALQASILPSLRVPQDEPRAPDPEPIVASIIPDAPTISPPAPLPRPSFWQRFVAALTRKA